MMQKCRVSPEIHRDYINRAVTNARIIQTNKFVERFWLNEEITQQTKRLDILRKNTYNQRLRKQKNLKSTEWDMSDGKLPAAKNEKARQKRQVLEAKISRLKQSKRHENYETVEPSVINDFAINMNHLNSTQEENTVRNNGFDLAVKPIRMPLRDQRMNQRIILQKQIC